MVAGNSHPFNDNSIVSRHQITKSNTTAAASDEHKVDDDDAAVIAYGKP